MQEALQLFLLLALLYLLETAIVLEEGALALLPSTRRLRWRRPLGELGPRRFGIAWGDVRPWREELVVEVSPVHLSADGLLGSSLRALPPAVRSASSGAHLRWDEVAAVRREGREVRVGARRIATCSTASGASRLAQLLAELASTPHERRRARLSTETRADLDVQQAATELASLREHSRLLRLATLTTLSLWPALLLASGWLGLERSWPALLGLALTSDLLLVVLYFRAHARLFPALADERWEAVPIAALFPPAAWRLLPRLGRGAVATWHPVAVALATGNRPTAERLARGYLRDLLHPVLTPLEGDADATAIEADSRTALLSELQRALREEGLSAEDLLARSDPPSAEARSRCPRCEAEYRHPGGECATCRGVTRVDLETGGRMP